MKARRPVSLLFQNAEDRGLDQNVTNGVSDKWSDPGYVHR